MKRLIKTYLRAWLMILGFTIAAILSMNTTHDFIQRTNMWLMFFMGVMFFIGIFEGFIQPQHEQEKRMLFAIIENLRLLVKIREIPMQDHEPKSSVN